MSNQVTRLCENCVKSAFNKCNICDQNYCGGSCDSQYEQLSYSFKSMYLKIENTTDLRTWQTCPAPPANKVFQAYICHMEGSLYWLSEVKKECAFHDLLQDMQRALPKSALLNCETIQINQLAMAILDNSPHRVEVLQIDRPNNTVYVRRIDHGDTLLINENMLYEPTDYMRNLPALVFAASIKNDTHENNINTNINVFWEAQQFSPEGFYLLTQRITGRDMPTIILMSEARVVKKMDMRNQLLFVVDPSLASHYEQFFAVIQKERLIRDDGTLRSGQFVLAWHKVSWKRAYLLCHNIWQKFHLAYLLDDGIVIFCAELCFLPAKFMQEDTRVFVLECVDKVNQLAFYFKGRLEIIEDKDVGTLRLDKHYRVKLLSPYQLFSECDYGFWFEELQHCDTVSIVSVYAVNEILVVGQHLSMLREVLTRLALECEAWTPDVAGENYENDLVVAHTQTSAGTSYFFRGHISSYGENELHIFDIDNGETEIVDASDVLRASDLVRALPAHIGYYVLPIQKSKKSSFELLGALNRLQLMADGQTKLKLLLIDQNQNIADMLYYHKSGKSHLLSELIFGAIINPYEHHQVGFFIGHLTKLPLTESAEINLDVTDFSELEKGILSVRSFSQKMMATIQSQNTAVNDYCEMRKQTCPGYAPRIDELCFAIFQKDQNYYRARCLFEMSRGYFMMQFIDTGSNHGIPMKDILGPFPSELLYPIMVHQCVIEGVDNLNTLKDTILTCPIINCKVVKKRGGFSITPQCIEPFYC